MAAPEASLEALVRDELRGPVSELVRQVVVELVREQLNGHPPLVLPEEATNGSARPSDAPRAGRKRCTVCGEYKGRNAFPGGRARCRKCLTAAKAQRARERRERERQRSSESTASGEPPGQATPAG